MAPNASNAAVARFGRFNVDLISCKLQRSGLNVPIQAKPFQVLRLLLIADGDVVRREQLRAVLWPKDTFVDFEHGVNTAVKKLRQALEDSAENPRFVETVPKIGYRFLASVEWGADTSNEHRFQPAGTDVAAELTPTATPGLPDRRKTQNAALLLVISLMVATTLFVLVRSSDRARTGVESLLRRIGIPYSFRSQPVVTELRLTANPDDTLVTSGVISPDGRLLAYSDSTGLYVRQVESGETHSVPLPSSVDPIVESWFPDGVHLLVSWVESPQRPPGLWQISVFGGVPRKVSDDGSSANLSPDGSQIVFTKRTALTEELWLAKVVGEGAKQLISSQEDHFSRATWAPDGKRLAYVRTKTRYYTSGRWPNTQIEVFDLDSRQTVIVRSEGERGLPDGGAALAWLPDNRLIYPVAEPRPNQQDTNLWSVRLDSRTAYPVGESTRITNGRGIVVELSRSSDGKRIALRRHAPQPDIYIADLIGARKKVSTPRRLTLDVRRDYVSAWTADSKAVLFYSNRDGPFHIFKQSIDATQPELLVGGKDDLYLPRMTPDGTSVVYEIRAKSGGPSKDAQLMRVPVSGGSAQFVLAAPGIFDFECARFPYTLCIYGQIQAGQMRFFTFDPVKGKGADLSRVKLDAASFNSSLSPDGRYFAWPRSRTPLDKFGIQIFSVTGEWKRDITVPGWVEIYGLDWAPDAMSLWACARDTRGKSGLLNLALDGSVRTMLSTPNLELEWALPSPDGRHLAINADSNSSNVWLLENF